MKKLTYISVLFFLFMSYAAHAQSDNQNAVSDWEKVVAEAKQGGYSLITPEEIEREYLKDPESLFLVDTRQDWAYQMQHIKGAEYLPVTPTWWYQYSPVARSEMKKVLGQDKNKKAIFY
jgi:hypothetical protein